MHFKFGINGGGGFLKVCLYILSVNEYNEILNSEFDEIRRGIFDGAVIGKKLKGAEVKKPNIIRLSRAHTRDI